MQQFLKFFDLAKGIVVLLGRRPVEAMIYRTSNIMSGPQSSNLVLAIRKPVRDLGSHNHLLKRLEHIRLEVLNVLNTARYSDQILEDACCLSLLFGDAEMCHRCWDFDEGL